MTIIVGVDGSAQSLDALRWAVEEARIRKTAVRAVHVWQSPVSVVVSDPFLGGPETDPLLIDPSELPRLAQQHLADVVRGAVSDPGAVEQLVVQGHPSEELVKAAQGAELLVVGSRGRGGFTGLLLGSVSHACAQHVRCPVVIVRGRPE